jgi:hypothetical protein
VDGYYGSVVIKMTSFVSVCNKQQRGPCEFLRAESINVAEFYQQIQAHVVTAIRNNGKCTTASNILKSQTSFHKPTNSVALVRE